MSYLADYCAKVGDFEGRYPYLYRDSVGLMTTAQGYMIPSLSVSYTLPWCMPDWTSAGESDISQDWARVSAIAPDLAASAYQDDEGLQLSQASIDALTMNAITTAVRGIVTAFPGYLTYPEGSQLGILDMAFNLGVHKLLNTYPLFCAAVRSQDWLRAANECGRNTSNPAFSQRNEWTKAQFLSEVAK
jgi:GH24 family phage-related lysozyme (muramidase)